MSPINLSNEHGITIAKRRTSSDLLFDQGPYAQLLLDLVRDAKNKGASDIHIEPTEEGIDFRVRIDGDLVQYKNIGIEHRESLLLEAKRIFGLSIGISGRPQDGRASFPELRLDLRVSLLPTFFGEKIVMRLLNLDASFDLLKLGFLEKEKEVLERSLRYENGVIAISGPTGSGKTRTLYALLKTLGPEKLNIVTLEDPIEYRIAGLNQVQVSSKISFSEALRAVLRQDPDVILVGEIRDAETAKLCFQAAETGHLVFTTLHANGALEVIERLSGLGVESLVLKSNLRLALAQRLEQKICPHCSHKIDEKGLRQRNMNGCEKCSQGILGRVPCLEWAVFDGQTKNDEPYLVQSLRDARLQRANRGELDFMEVKK